MSEVVVAVKIDFNNRVEELVVTKRIPYMEAVIMACAESEIEVESASKLIVGRVKRAIKAEATALNMMRKEKRR